MGGILHTDDTARWPTKKKYFGNSVMGLSQKKIPSRSVKMPGLSEWVLILIAPGILLDLSPWCYVPKGLLLNNNTITVPLLGEGHTEKILLTQRRHEH